MRPALIFILALACLAPSGLAARSTSASPFPGGYAVGGAVPGATFPEMLDMAMVPGAPDEAVVITQGGLLWRVSLSGAFAPYAFGDVRDRMTRQSDEGLLGVVFSPHFATDGRVYVNYTAGTEYQRLNPQTTDPKRNVIARYRVAGGVMQMDSEEVLLQVIQPNYWHNVNNMVFGPDGLLYVGSGDGGGLYAEYDTNAGQGLDNLLATIFRIDVSPAVGYAIPPSNPFADGSGPHADEIFAYGLRNPYRISFDSLTGELWAGDVGAWDWEEVDKISAGGNYGWSVMEGFTCFNIPDPNGCDKTPYLPPRVAYGHTDGDCAIIGGFVYRGTQMPELDGFYVYGDFCSGRIWALDTTSPDSAPVLLADTPYHISSFAQMPNGELLILTYNNAIYRLGSAPGSGNADCDGAVDSTDALKVLRYSAGLSVSQSEPCTDIGALLPGGVRQGDVNCSGGVDSKDALLILRAVAGLPVAVPAGCPAIKPA